MGYKPIVRDPGLALKEFVDNHTNSTFTSATYVHGLKTSLAWVNTKKLRSHHQVTIDHVIDTVRDSTISRQLKDTRSLWYVNVWVTASTFRTSAGVQTTIPKQIRYDINKEMRKIFYVNGQDTDSTVLTNSGVKNINYNNSQNFIPESLEDGRRVLRTRHEVELRYFEQVT